MSSCLHVYGIHQCSNEENNVDNFCIGLPTYLASIYIHMYLLNLQYYAILNGKSWKVFNPRSDFNALFPQTILVCQKQRFKIVQYYVVPTLRFHGKEQDLEQIGGLGCKIDISESDDQGQ